MYVLSCFFSQSCDNRYGYIAANPPEFFGIIRKSELEYKFPNDEFCFRIRKIHFFSFSFLSFFLVFRRRHSMSTCCNQHSRAFSDFVLQRMRCRLQFTSRSCARAPFSSASGGTPPSRTLPHWLGITNCRLAAMWLAGLKKAIDPSICSIVPVCVDLCVSVCMSLWASVAVHSEQKKGGGMQVKMLNQINISSAKQLLMYIINYLQKIV